jgi:hypothetical protein
MPQQQKNGSFVDDQHQVSGHTIAFGIKDLKQRNITGTLKACLPMVLKTFISSQNM